MTRLATVFCVAAFSVCTPASAQLSPRTGELPAANVEQSINVGQNLHETFSYFRAPGVRVPTEMRVALNNGGEIVVPAGTVLYIMRDDNRPKACMTVPLPALMFNPCAIDMDRDGDFDRLAMNEVAGAKDLLPPVPYERGHDFIYKGSSGSFRNVLIYQGYAQNVLRLSYREFSNDLARPAFTEDYTLEVGPTFPAVVSVRNQRFEILGIASGTLTYRRLQ